MKIRRYKHIHTETVEEEHIPSKRRRTIMSIPVPPRPLKRARQPYTLTPQQPGLVSPLALKSLALAALGVLGMLMMTAMVCALVGFFISRPAPRQEVAYRRAPALTGAHLPTFTPTPAGAQVVTVPTPTVGNAAVIAVVPTATPFNVYPTPVPAANNQNSSRAMLTSRVNLNVRAGPGLGHAVVGKLATGQAVAIVGRNPDGSWWQVEYPAGSGRQAWVSADPQYSTVSQGMPQAIAQGPAAPAIAPTPTSRPVVIAATATPAASETAGWTFAAMRADAIPTRKMLMLFGEMVNQTGAAQQISTITGTFYDAQGQLLAADKSTYGLWPTKVVAPGGRVPFALTVYDVQEAGNFELSVQSKTVETGPRHDFEFLAVSEQMKGNNYCLGGALKNPGGQLANYLVITAVLYDEQGNVLRFGNNNKIAYQNMVGDQTTDFEVCVKSPPSNVASHDLLAWGI
jgi:uncharacterized protein YraI